MPIDIWAEPSVKEFGKIIDIRFELIPFTNDDGEEQEQEKIIVEIENLGQKLDWNRTVRFTRASANNPNSKWARWKAHMNEIGHPIRNQDDLIGHCFQFNIITLDPDRGQYASPNYPKPVVHFESEADCIAAAGSAGSETGTDVADNSANPAYERLMEIADGKTFNQILTAVLSDEELKGNGEFVSALATNRGPLNELVAAGSLILDGEEYKVSQ